MSSRARFSVPGEEVPGFVTAAIGALGVLSAGLAGLGLLPGTPIGQAPPRIAAASDVDGSTTVSNPRQADGPTARGLDAGTAEASAVEVPVASPAPSKCPPLIVTFARAMPSPPKNANAPLEKLGHWLSEHPDVSVVLDGHADSKGSEDENLWLSRQRASSVKTALERAGAPKARLTTRAFGSFWPADEAPPDASWNRRVVVQTKGDSCPRETEEVVGP